MDIPSASPARIQCQAPCPAAANRRSHNCMSIREARLSTVALLGTTPSSPSSRQYIQDLMLFRGLDVREQERSIWTSLTTTMSWPSDLQSINRYQRTRMSPKPSLRQLSPAALGHDPGHTAADVRNTLWVGMDEGPIGTPTLCRILEPIWLVGMLRPWKPTPPSTSSKGWQRKAQTSWVQQSGLDRLLNAFVTSRRVIWDASTNAFPAPSEWIEATKRATEYWYSCCLTLGTADVLVSTLHQQLGFLAVFE